MVMSEIPGNNRVQVTLIMIQIYSEFNINFHIISKTSLSKFRNVYYNKIKIQLKFFSSLFII